MISPNFATMLCFVQTDAILEPHTADLLLGVCVKRSFDRCSVDGQLSTNDTAVLMCSGSSGVEVQPESEDELRFGEALDALLRQLAILMVADGEGAARIARVVVRGGHAAGVEAVARGVANSPLVKTALHGADPNWGRVIQATGAALAGADWFPGRSCSTCRSRARSSARPAPRSTATRTRSLKRFRGGRSNTRSRCPAMAPRPRCSSPTSATSMYGSTRSTRHERCVHTAVAPTQPVRCETGDGNPATRAELDSLPSNQPEGYLMRDVGTLLEALPYIREFHGKTVVIKYGGAAMNDPALREEFARDVVLLKYVGLNPIVVHGGGPDITAYMERLGLPVEFVGGLRVSDEITVEVAKMVLVGKVNTEIVLRINRHGQPAIGLCGDDGSLFRVARRTAPGGEDIGFVGRIERVDVDVLNHVATDYIPVIASVGADRDGHSYNVNADEAAGAVAGALGAYKVIFLTDVPGWLRDPSEEGSLIGQASAEQVRAALDSLEGGMRPKLQACVDAIGAGVSAAHILDGRLAHSLLLELFTDAGIGTKIEVSA